MNGPLYFFKDYLIERYGVPLYRVPIALPYGCPSRRANHGRGCVYCDETGARARHLRARLDLPGQVKAGIDYVERRYRAASGYIAYFQAFTPTFAPIDVLRRDYETVLRQADFRLAMVSTRPDCLPPEVLDYFSELRERYGDFWVELGVQTANDATNRRTDRGHDFAAVERACRDLSERGIKVAAHVILGLPGEGVADFRATVAALRGLPFSAVKIHQLMVLRGAPLAKIHAEGAAPVMDEREYAAALVDFVRRVPADRPLLRIAADADPERTIAPKWTLSKGQFIEYVKTAMASRGWKQGDLVGQADDGMVLSPLDAPIRTDDGSITFYHPGFKEHFHSLAGAASEALEKFAKPALPREIFFAGTRARVLDIGFGLGYNALAATRLAREFDAPLEVVSLDLDEAPSRLALTLYSETDWEKQALLALTQEGRWEDGLRRLELVLGDARQTLSRASGRFDAVFLDAFSTEKNPELWTYDFIRALAARLAPSGVLVTYSAAYPVRGAMLRAGLIVGETPAFGRRKGGTIASPDPTRVATPLSPKDAGIVRFSTAGVPYRDRGLCRSAADILAFHRKVLLKKRAMGVPRWYRPTDAEAVREKNAPTI